MWRAVDTTRGSRPHTYASPSATHTLGEALDDGVEGAGVADFGGAEAFGARGDSPVGQGRPNPFGLHDVLGNVAEWCRDPFGRYTDPVAPGSGERLALDLEHRIRRGGAYNAREPSGLRVATRSFYPPAARRSDTGVRPARPLEPRRE